MTKTIPSEENKSRPAVGWVIKVVLVLLMLFGLMAGFFWAHKPFDFAIVAGLGKTLFSIIVWLGITWLAAALGWLVVGRLLTDEKPAARLALSTGVGLGLLSLIVMGLGMAGLLRPLFAWGLVLLLALLLRASLRATLSELRALRFPGPSSTFQRWLLIYGSASLLLTFLSALAPVTAWDSLVYHLTGPRLYIEAGRVVHPIDLPYLGFPLLAQMQFALSMLLGGDRVPALFHFGYGLMALAITVSLARRAFGDNVAWLAGTILLSVPTLFTLMSWPYVDAILLFYATAAFYAFFRWRQHKDDGAGRYWLVLMGLFSGFGGGVKYTAVAVPFALGLSLIWESRTDGLRAIVTRLATVAFVAVIVVLPWPLENWLTTDNPVYPFFFDNALYWDEWRGWWYDRPGTGLAATSPWRLLVVPFEATILGTEGTEFYEATLGPLLLTGGLLLAFVWPGVKREERALTGHMLLFFGLNYLLWINGVARTALLLRARFLFLVFGVVAVMGGLAFDRLSHLKRPEFAIDWMARTVISLTIGLLLFSMFVSFLQSNPLPVLFGLESEESYLRRHLGLYQEVMEAVNELPENAQVVFLWEPRSYACQVDCRPDALLDRFLHLTHYYGYDADEMAAHWRDKGATHVLLHQAGLDFVDEAGFDPVTQDDLLVMQELRTTYLSPVRQWQDAYTLFELNP